MWINGNTGRSLSAILIVLVVADLTAYGQTRTVSQGFSYSLATNDLKLRISEYSSDDPYVENFLEMIFDKPVQDSVKRSSEFADLSGEVLDNELTKKYPHIFKAIDTGVYVDGLKETRSSDEIGSTVQYLSYQWVNTCNWVEIRKSSKTTYHEGGYGRANSTMFIDLRTGALFEVEGFARFLTCDVVYGKSETTFSWRHIKNKGEVTLRFDNDWKIGRYAVQSTFFLLELVNAEKKMKYLHVKTDQMP